MFPLEDHLLRGQIRDPIFIQNSKFDQIHLSIEASVDHHTDY